MTFNGRGNAALTREEATCLVDACRDGDIGEADVSRLTSLLEAHDERAMWILDELELSGLIAQALDSTDTNSFLRGFLERLAAEKPTDDFADVAEQRLSEKGDPSQLQQPSSGSADAIGMMFGQKSGTVSASERLRPAVQLRFVLLGIAVIALVVGGILLATRSTPSHGRIVSASPGVMVSRKAGEIRAAAGMQLRAGDIVQVPSDARAVLSYEDGTRVKILARTRLILEANDTGQRILLESGQVTVETPGTTEENPVTIASAHARMSSVTASEYSVTATPTSTRLVVLVGEVDFRRHDTGEGRIVRPDEEAVTTAGE